MSNLEILQNQIKTWAEGGVEATSITADNHFFIALCLELKINPENCIDNNNYGVITIFGIKIITSFPLLTAPNG